MIESCFSRFQRTTFALGNILFNRRSREKEGTNARDILYTGPPRTKEGTIDKDVHGPMKN